MRLLYKALTIFFVSASFVLANNYEDTSPIEKSIDSNLNIDTTKSNNFDLLISLKLVGVGYTSTKRLELNGLSISIMGAFDNKRLEIDFIPLRFDRRLTRKENGKEINESSLGAIIGTLVFGSISRFTDKKSTMRKTAIGGLWLSSGSTQFAVIENPIFGISLVETHAFEWFLSNTKHDRKTDYAFNEVGFIEEIGVQLNLVVAYISSGISLEVTNKQRNIGWYAKLFFLAIPFESRQWSEGHK